MLHSRVFVSSGCDLGAPLLFTRWVFTRLGIDLLE